MRVRHKDPFLLAIQKAAWEAGRDAAAEQAAGYSHPTAFSIAAAISNLQFPETAHVPSGEALTPIEAAILSASRR